MRAYSADLRERVLADCDGGLGTRAVAAEYRASESRVRRLKQARREAGRTTPATQRRGPAPGWVAHADAIRAAVAAAPGATPAEYRPRLAVRSSRPALAGAPVALGRSRNKRPSGPAGRTARTERRPGPRGGPARRGWSRTGWGSRARRGRAPAWPGPTAGARRARGR